MTLKSMRVVIAKSAGGPEVLQVEESAIPEPASNQVLIEVHAAGINRADLMQRSGDYPPPKDASPVLGLEVAGVIVQSPRQSQWRTGDRVCALVHGGGYAEYCVADSGACLAIPDAIEFNEAAGIPETFFTVWSNVFELGRLVEGERFFVHGGTSGIGTIAIQLAKAFGAEVYATAGTDAKCEACRNLGAKQAFNYKEVDFVAALKTATDGHGVDVILDMIGGAYTERNIECLAMDGRIVQIATQDNPLVQLNLLKLMRKRGVLTGSMLRPRSDADKSRIASELREKVWPMLENGTVNVVVDRVFPIDNVQDAHRYMDAGTHIGKVVLAMK